MSLGLLRDHTAFVEPVGNSGMTESGIYVFDHDNTRDMAGQRATIMYRVLETKNCPDLEVGKVYIVDNPYNYTDLDHEGERRLVMRDSNFVAEVDGYDAACYEVEPELSDAPSLYGACGK